MSRCSILSFVLAGVVAACGGSPDEPDGLPVDPGTEVLEIVPKNDTVYVGAVGSFGIDYKRNGTSMTPPSITWMAPTSPVATIRSKGEYYASGVGEMTVTASATGVVSGTLTATGKLVVLDPPFVEGSVELPSSTVTDLTYDGRRNVVYIGLADNRIAVLSLATLTFGTQIDLPSSPAGLDVSNKDVLVVALPIENGVGEIALKTRITQVYALNAANGSRKTAGVKVTSDNHALVATDPPPAAGSDGRLVDFDLGVHAEVTRSDLPSLRKIFRLGRSADGHRVVIRGDEPFASPGDLTPSPGYVYDGWTRTIGAQKTVFGNGDGAISLSVDGSHALSWRVRYSSALAAEDSATSTSYSVGPTTISADGTVGYFAVDNSVVGVAFATNGVVKTLNYPSPPKRIFALPSGKALVVITATSVYVSAL